MKVTLKHDVNNHFKSVVSLKYSESGVLLASCAADKKTNIFNSTTGDIVQTLEGEHSSGVNDCAWISENLIATGSDDQLVKIWDIEMNKVVATFKGAKSFVYSLTVNPINRAIISGGYDGSVSMFHMSSRDAIMRFGAHSEPIVSIAVDSQGQHYATGAQDGLIRIWNPAGAGMCVKTIIATESQSFPLSCISYSPNSRYILASSLDSKHRLHSCDLSGDNDVLIRRQQQASRDPLQPVRQDAVRTLSGHVNNKFSVQSTLFSNTGRSYVLSGSEDSKVCIWDLESGAAVASLEGHQGAVLAVAANPDPSRHQLASAGIDATVKLWEVQSEMEM